MKVIYQDLIGFKGMWILEIWNWSSLNLEEFHINELTQIMERVFVENTRNRGLMQNAESDETNSAVWKL